MGIVKREAVGRDGTRDRQGCQLTGTTVKAGARSGQGTWVD